MPNYKIQLTDDVERRRLYDGPLPGDIAKIVEEALGELLADPWGKSRIPEYPFPPVGRVFSFSFRYGNSIYGAYYFFHIDDDRKEVVTRRAMLIPPFEPLDPLPNEPARRLTSPNTPDQAKQG